MPKPLLSRQQAELQTDLLSATAPRQKEQQNQQMNAMVQERLLRQKRSREYLELMHRLDAGGRINTKEQVHQIIEAVRAELPEVELGGILLGMVSVCYLGVPFEVHTVDFATEIIEHYQRGQPLPYGMEKARTLAMSGAYEVIEVYTNCCRAISPNGTVSVIPD